MIKTNEVWKQIEEIVKDIPGWSPIDELYTLFMLALMSKGLDGDIVEVGAWCGRSSVILGKAVQISNEKKKVYSIDLFPDKEDWEKNKDGSYSFKVKFKDKSISAYQVQTVWKEPYEKDIIPVYQINNSILNIWKQSINKNNLNDINTYFKGDSNMFFNEFSIENKIKLAFLDGDHSYEATKTDIRNVEKHLVKGGYICFDDAFSTYEGVNKAITENIINSNKYDICQQMTRKFFIARKNKY